MSEQGIPRPAVITEITSLTADTSLFRVRPEERIAVLAGQFVQLSVPAAGEAPFSVAGAADDDCLDLCVRRVGHVTEALHRLEKGAQVGIRGPFGHGFPLGEMAGHDLLLVAGGLGIAPLRALLFGLLRERKRYGRITLMYGFRDPSNILFREDMLLFSRRTDLALLLSADDIGPGIPEIPHVVEGMVTTLFGRADISDNSCAAVCGPPPFYRAVTAQLLSRGLQPGNIYLSLERRMKCGVGRCCHCGIGPYLCCTDGPVFRYDRIAAVGGAL